VGTETSSLALSEGMSLGVPCVVSDYGGNPYMVRHGENGLVYPAGDVDRLAKSIKFMLSKEDEYKKMSDASLTRFKSELNCASMTEKTNRLYDMLCKQ
jgi:glycosyltransferase involved in cell wall biosynthesis